jgi:hypothetical protein
MAFGIRHCVAKSLRGWRVEDGAWVREYQGHSLRVTCEGPGYRLWVDGLKRTYHDTTAQARTKALCLVRGEEQGQMPAAQARAVEASP